MIVINTMPCSICKKSGHNRVTCVDALRMPACSEGEALFARREDATSPCSVGKETPSPRERGVFVKHTLASPQRGVGTLASPRERGVGTLASPQSVPTEECDATEKRDTQEMKRKPEDTESLRDVPTEEKEAPQERCVDVTFSPTERGVGTLASPQSVPTQAHGFSLEKDIMRTIYRMTEEELQSIPYTSKVDIPAELNRLDHCDVSIKTSCSLHTVCMADCLRFYDSVRSGNPIHMIVVHYHQLGDIKKIVTITEVDLTDSCEALFGSLTRADIETLDRAVKAVPQKKKPTEEEHKTMYDIRDSLQKQSGAIHLNIKCNSTQSRLQCSFNRFQQFLESHPTRIVAKSNTHEFRGGALSPQIVSSRRVFKPKGKVYMGTECLHERGVGFVPPQQSH